MIDAGAVEYVEYTFPYFDIDAGQDLWNNIPSYEQDVRWYELYSECSLSLPLSPQAPPRRREPPPLSFSSVIPHEE